MNIGVRMSLGATILCGAAITDQTHPLVPRIRSLDPQRCFDKPPHITVTLLQVRGYCGPEEMNDAFDGADLIIIPAGVPRKPGGTTYVNSNHHQRHRFQIIVKLRSVCVFPLINIRDG